jgi:hypothetical protein
MKVRCFWLRKRENIGPLYQGNSDFTVTAGCAVKRVFSSSVTLATGAVAQSRQMTSALLTLAFSRAHHSLEKARGSGASAGTTTIADNCLDGNFLAIWRCDFEGVLKSVNLTVEVDRFVSGNSEQNPLLEPDAQPPRQSAKIAGMKK